MPTGQPDPDNSSLRVYSPGFPGCVKLTIKTHQHKLPELLRQYISPEETVLSLCSSWKMIISVFIFIATVLFKNLHIAFLISEVFI